MMGGYTGVGTERMWQEEMDIGGEFGVDNTSYYT